MPRNKILYVPFLALLLLAGCNTGFHGSFVPNTYFSDEAHPDAERIGPVVGQSCQTKVLYLFPLGEAPSTAEAVQAAKDQREGTQFLTDISIDDRIKWEIGYSMHCITVEGFAHR